MKCAILFLTTALLIPIGMNAQQKPIPKTITMEEAKLTCKLSTPELQQRKKTVVAELKNLVLDKIETEGGYKYKFNGSDKMLDLLNSFIKTERLCCDFFVFTLTASSDNSYAWLELTGPKGIKEFIKYDIEF